MDADSTKISDEQHQQLLFMMLIQQHEQIAMMGLGKIKNPSTDAIERDLKTAKYAIDTLTMLEKFTTGNLSVDLSGYLQHKLSTLRLNYVDEVNADKKKASE